MATLQKRLYTVSATAEGGREGHVKAGDGQLSMDMRPPTEMGGPGGAPNPEMLFAAGYAACYQGALAAAGRRLKIDTSASKVTVAISFGAIGEGSFGIAADMKVTVPGVDAEKVKELTEIAHTICPYSNATRGNIDITTTVE